MKIIQKVLIATILIYVTMIVDFVVDRETVNAEIHQDPYALLKVVICLKGSAVPVGLCFVPKHKLVLAFLKSV